MDLYLAKINCASSGGRPASLPSSPPRFGPLPASLTDQPLLLHFAFLLRSQSSHHFHVVAFVACDSPVAALATVLLARVRAFRRSDEMGNLVGNSSGVTRRAAAASDLSDGSRRRIRVSLSIVASTPGTGHGGLLPREFPS